MLSSPFKFEEASKASGSKNIALGLVGYVFRLESSSNFQKGHMINYKISGMYILSNLVRLTWRLCKVIATIYFLHVLVEGLVQAWFRLMMFSMVEKVTCN